MNVCVFHRVHCPWHFGVDVLCRAVLIGDVFVVYEHMVLKIVTLKNS